MLFALSPHGAAKGKQGVLVEVGAKKERKRGLLCGKARAWLKPGEQAQSASVSLIDGCTNDVVLVTTLLLPHTNIILDVISGHPRPMRITHGARSLVAHAATTSSFARVLGPHKQV